MYLNPIGLFQHIRDIILERLASIKMKHSLKMEFYTLLEGWPAFGGILGMGDTEDILPRCLRDLGLEDLLPRLACFASKKVRV